MHKHFLKLYESNLRFIGTNYVLVCAAYMTLFVPFDPSHSLNGQLPVTVANESVIYLYN